MSDGQGVTLSGRPIHPATERMLRNFEDDHLPDHLRIVTQPIRLMLADLIDRLPLDDPETTWGLRCLLLAKDGFVRAAVEQRRRMSGEAP